MVISKNTNLSIFHDAEIGLVEYDYMHKTIHINLTLNCLLAFASLLTLNGLSNNSKAVLTGLKTSHIYFQSLEPWGTGKYINQVEIDEKQENQEITIQFNSGDTFKIIAKSFELQGK